MSSVSDDDVEAVLVEVVVATDETVVMASARPVAVTGSTGRPKRMGREKCAGPDFSDDERKRAPNAAAAPFHRRDRRREAFSDPSGVHFARRRQPGENEERMPVISTNTAANTALRYLNANSAAQSASVAKLSSGQRIQSARDDAAGLATSTNIAADVVVLEQASINAQQGTAVLQTADGALSQISDILQRMKSLTAQSQTGSVDDDGRANIDAEYQQLLEEVGDIATSTNFNGSTLLDGAGDYSTGVSFLLGTSSTDVLTVTIDGVTASDLGIDGTDVTSADNAATAMDAIDGAINSISTSRANVGASLSRFDYRASVIDTSLENLEAAKSAISDVDLASEQTNYTTLSTLTQAAIAALSQANSMSQSLLKLLQ
jgi:flagellin